MSDKSTKHMITPYIDEAPATQFLTGFFQAPPQNFFNSESIEMDIERDGAAIAIVITDLTTGIRMNESSIYSNKEYIPPIYGEGITLSSKELLNRDIGNDPFANLNYRASIISRILKGAAKVQNKIIRAVELNASQVMQTGTITLIDSDSNTMFEMSFSPKATHFTQTATSWSAAGADPEADLESLNDTIRKDGKKPVDQFIMGATAFRNFIRNSKIQAKFDNRRIDQGTISVVQPRGEGGKYHGTVEIGSELIDVWTYAGYFAHPDTGTDTPYVDDNKVIARASTGRMDAVFGNVPHIGRALGLTKDIVPGLPARISSAGKVMDIHPHAWLSIDGRQLFASASSRPLLIPTAIDTFGCLNVVQP